MDDGEDKDDVGGEVVDDAVALNDELSHIVPVVGFGDGPTDFRVIRQFVGGLDEPINEQFRVIRDVAGDVLIDVIEIGLGDI